MIVVPEGSGVRWAFVVVGAICILAMISLVNWEAAASPGRLAFDIFILGLVLVNALVLPGVNWPPRRRSWLIRAVTATGVFSCAVVVWRTIKPHLGTPAGSELMRTAVLSFVLTICLNVLLYQLSRRFGRRSSEGRDGLK